MNATITESQIRTLRAEARAAGDDIQAVICDVALDEVNTSDPSTLDEDGLPDYSSGGHSVSDLRKIRAWLRSSQEDAWAECVRIIAEAA